MKRKNKKIWNVYTAFPIYAIAIICLLSACDQKYADNPHGIAYLDTQTPTAKGPDVPLAKTLLPPHIRPAGLGAPLTTFVQKYGAPKGGYSHPPLYAFQVGPDSYSNGGSILIVTIQNDRAIEFSYVAGNQHPMTYQEAQEIIAKLLPDDVTSPTLVHPADDSKKQCLVKAYQSDSLALLFQHQDFLASSGTDAKVGSITANFFPDLSSRTIYGQDSGSLNGDSILANTTNVSSVLVNLGSKPAC
jgi:hypothetical protein